MPRAASGPLTTLLNSGKEFFVVDLVTITQANGAVTRLTAGDRPIVANGFTFSAGLPWERDRITLKVGFEVSNLKLVLYPDPLVHTLGGVPWPAAVRAGALDEARVVVEKVFSANYGDASAGTLIQFAGRVGKAIPSRTAIELDIVADVELLSAAMPRNSYQPGCVHTLFDTGCGLAKSSWLTSGTATGGTTSTLTSGLAQATGYFDLGTVTFTSGALTGKTFTVQSFAGGQFNFAAPLPAAPAAGDTFNAYPGCDKVQATCSGKFSNLGRFRGYPYIPTPENAR